MDGLITWFKLLLFLETVLLTPAPVTIGDEWVTVNPQEPLEAITGGAAIYVEVTEHAKPLEIERARKEFPTGMIKGELETANGMTISLTNVGTSLSRHAVRLVVASDTPVPVGLEFTVVRLKSAIPLEGVDVYWKNGSH